jgi:hypothetical protein
MSERKITKEEIASLKRLAIVEKELESLKNSKVDSNLKSIHKSGLVDLASITKVTNLEAKDTFTNTIDIKNNTIVLKFTKKIKFL